MFIQVLVRCLRVKGPGFPLIYIRHAAQADPDSEDFYQYQLLILIQRLP